MTVSSVFIRLAAVIFSCQSMVVAALPEIVPDVLKLQSSYRQGAVVRGVAPKDTRVYLGARELRTSSKGDFIFGISRDERKNQRLFYTDSNGDRFQLDLRVNARTYNIQRVDGVPEKTVNPAKADLDRIGKEAALASRARDIDSHLNDFASVFTWPLIGPITGVYGSQRVYNGTPKNPHFGVDVARPTGSLVTAPAGGVVRLAYPDMYFSGGTLIVDHGHGLTSTFMHLSAILVKEGQRIEQGDVIAKVGATGRATGPHLDWRMNWFEHRVDPQTLVGPMPKQ